MPITVKPGEKGELHFSLRLPTHTGGAMGRRRACVVLVLEMGGTGGTLFIPRKFSVRFVSGNVDSIALNPAAKAFVPKIHWKIAHAPPTNVVTYKIPEEHLLPFSVPEWLAQPRTARLELLTEYLLDNYFPEELRQSARAVLTATPDAATLPLPGDSEADRAATTAMLLQLARPADVLCSKLGGLSPATDVAYFLFALHLEELQHAADACTYSLPVAFLKNFRKQGNLCTVELAVPGMMENRPELAIYDTVRLRLVAFGSKPVAQIEGRVQSILKPRGSDGHRAILQVPSLDPKIVDFDNAANGWVALFNHVVDHFDIMCVRVVWQQAHRQ